MGTLICSDPECGEVEDLWRELEELEATLCDCGCALLAIAFYEGVPLLAADRQEPEPLAA